MTMIKGNRLCLSRSQRNYLIKVKAKLDIHSTLSDPFDKNVSHTMWLDTLSDRVSVDRVLQDGTYEIIDRGWLNKLNENYYKGKRLFYSKGNSTNT